MMDEKTTNWKEGFRAQLVQRKKGLEQELKRKEQELMRKEQELKEIEGVIHYLGRESERELPSIAPVKPVGVASVKKPKCYDEKPEIVPLESVELDSKAISRILNRRYVFTVKAMVKNLPAGQRKFRFAYGYLRFLLEQGKVCKTEDGRYKVKSAARRVTRLTPAKKVTSAMAPLDELVS